MHNVHVGYAPKIPPLRELRRGMEAKAGYLPRNTRVHEKTFLVVASADDAASILSEVRTVELTTSIERAFLGASSTLKRPCVFLRWSRPIEGSLNPRRICDGCILRPLSIDSDVRLHVEVRAKGSWIHIGRPMSAYVVQRVQVPPSGDYTR